MIIAELSSKYGISFFPLIDNNPSQEFIAAGLQQ